MVPASKPSAWEAKAGGIVWGQGQCGAHSKQDSQSYSGLPHVEEMAESAFLTGGRGKLLL